MGGPSSVPHLLGWACAPGRLCPKDATSLSQLSTAICLMQAGSHHHVPLASVTPPHSPARCTRSVTTALGAALLQAGASVALPRALAHTSCPRQQSQRKGSTVMCRSHTWPRRNRHHIPLPKGPAQHRGATR